MPQPDPFVDNRTDALIGRFSTGLNKLRKRWSQGILMIADPDVMALWVIPTEPLSVDVPSYSQIIETLNTQPAWACLAEDWDTANEARKLRAVPAPVVSSQLRNVHTSLYYQ